MPRGIYKRTKPIWNKGKKRPQFSDEWKRKMSLSKVGNKNRLGVPHSIETRKKICRGLLNSKRFKNKVRISSKNERISKSIEYCLWREAVFARDGYTCQKCKQWGGKLRSHHIQNFAKYSEIRFAIDNGITLCQNCHFVFHKIYGKYNNTKKQIDEFI